MSTRDLIDAIEAGDSTRIQSEFHTEILNRVSERLSEMRKNVAQSMFNSEGLEEADMSATKPAKPAKPATVHPDAIHIQHVGSGKYKVHAVGKNWSDGIKAGDHLSDSELDDFTDMGGKIKLHK